MRAFAYDPLHSQFPRSTSHLALARRVAFFLFASFLTIAAHSQANLQQNQLRQFGANQDFGADSVDLTSLTSNFEIPLLKKTGRGQNLDLHLSYAASSTLVQYAGWTSPLQNLVGQGTVSVIGCSNAGCGYKATWVDPFGVKHGWEFGTGRAGITCSNSCMTGDGSGLILSPATAGNTGTITARDGSSWKVVFSSDGFTPGGSSGDGNGNQITESATSVQDTLGATIQLKNFSPLTSPTNITTYGGVTSGTPPPAETYSYTDSNGNTQTVAINYSLETIDSVLPASTCASNYAIPPSPYSGLGNLPSSVSLPNSTSYSFLYEASPNTAGTTTGRVSQFKLPTGGTIAYAYPSAAGLIPNDPNCADGGVFFLNRTTANGTWKFTRTLSNYGYGACVEAGNCSSYPPPILTTTMVDPAGNTSVYKFFPYTFGPFNNYTYFLTDKAVYNGGATGTPILHQQVCYNGFAPPCANETAATLPAAAQSGQLIGTKDVYTSYNGGASSRVTTTYGWPLIVPTEVDEYDFGATTPSRKTITTYYTMNGLMSNKPLTVVVEDGSGKIFSQTQYGYDETTAVATSGVASHAAVTGQRGNLTSTSAWSSTTNTWLKFVYTNDDTGNRLTEQDPNTVLAGKTTYTNQYSYNDSWYSNASTCSANTNAFLTKSLDALGHITKNAYDACTGLIRQTQDPNDLAAGRAGTITSYDEMNNILTTSYPDGGSVTLSYGSYANPLTIKTTTAASPDPSQVKVTIEDGYGRTVQTQLTSDPSGTDYTDTTYDADGRVYGVSNPYRSKSETTYGLTTTLYDALDRKTIVTNPDGSKQQWCYNGAGAAGQTNCHALVAGSVQWVDHADESGNDWQQTSDGLGRMTYLFEPNGTSTAPALETSYTYDPLNNLLSVTQWGGPSGTSGARSRTFTYDSLSRLVQAMNPESGWTCYGTTGGTTAGIGANGTNCTVGYDANGNSLYKTDARGATTDFTYDLLNRLTGKTYWDGSVADSTPTVTMHYDETSVAVGTSPNAHIGPYSTGNGIGRLTSQYTGYSAPGVGLTVKSFSYDPMGRVTGTAECWGATECASTVGTRASSFAYDLAGNRTSMNNSASRAFSYTYNGAGWLVTESNTFGTITTPMVNAMTYYASGLPQSMTTNVTSATVSGTWGADDRQRVISFTNQSTASAGYTSYGYSLTYTLNNSVKTAAETVLKPAKTPESWTWTYNYDTLNRLSNSSTTGNLALGCQETYDAWGNRLSQQPYGTGNSCTSISTPVGTNNRLSGGAYQYDAAGNLLYDGTNTLTYDAEERIASSTSKSITTTYLYGADGQRAAKTAGGVETTYVRDLDGSLLTTYVGGNYLGYPQEMWVSGKHFGTVVASSSSAQTQLFSLTNWLGSETARIDPTQGGDPVSSYVSLPFGDGQTIYFGSDTDDVHFTGKERDNESGNDYFGARYYSSTAGRFMSPDPSVLDYADQTNPQSLNLYSYVLNNPLINIDPTGMYCDYSDHNDPRSGFDDSQFDYNSTSNECKQNGGQWVNDAETHKTKDGYADNDGRDQFAVPVISTPPAPGADPEFDRWVLMDQKWLKAREPQILDVDPSLALATAVMSQGIPKACAMGVTASFKKFTANVSISGNGVGASFGTHSVGTPAPQNTGTGKVSVPLGGPNGTVPFSVYHNSKGVLNGVTSVSADLTVKKIGITPYVNLGTYTPNIKDPQNCPD